MASVKLEWHLHRPDRDTWEAAKTVQNLLLKLQEDHFDLCPNRLALFHHPITNRTTREARLLVARLNTCTAHRATGLETISRKAMAYTPTCIPARTHQLPRRSGHTSIMPIRILMEQIHMARPLRPRTSNSCKAPRQAISGRFQSSHSQLTARTSP